MRKHLSPQSWGPAKSGRMALAALIIQEKLCTTDRNVIEHIRENPYLQYFMGFESYIDFTPFHHSIMTYYRKRISGSLIKEINEIIFDDCMEEVVKKN